MTTHTVAMLAISERAYTEIARAMKDVGYTHAFGRDYISMNGLSITPVNAAAEAAAEEEGGPDVEGIYANPPTLKTDRIIGEALGIETYSVSAELFGQAPQSALFFGGHALERAVDYATDQYGTYADPEDLMQVSTDGVIGHPVEAHPVDNPPCVFLLHTIRGGKDPDDFWHVLSEDIRDKIASSDPWKTLSVIENDPHQPGIIMGYLTEAAARSWVEEHGYQLADEVMAAIGY